MGMPFIFDDMIEMTSHVQSDVHHVFALRQRYNFSRIEALDFHVFIVAYSINSETNRQIRCKK